MTATAGHLFPPQSIVYGNTASQPTAPTKEHGAFAGWYTSDGEAYDFTTPVKSDLTLYAAWDDVQYVTFNYGNGTASRRETVEKGQTVSAPEAPTWQGFAFRGWYTSDGSAYNFSSPVNDDVVLTAKWAASYIDENGREQWLEPDEYTSAAIDSHQWVGGNSSSPRWFVVTGNDTIYSYVLLRGNIHLILADGLTLRIMKGIEVPDSSSLTVYAQSEGTGRLVTTGGTIYSQSGVPATYSGIGGSWNGNDSSQNNGHCGTINVYGGNIEATGCDDVPASNLAQFYYTPAIGGSVTGTVNIYGGSVKAYGAYGEAGLGGFGTHVNIYGGTVEAYGGKDRSSTPVYNGKGIEGGYVHLYGGNVTGIGSVGIEGSTLTLSWTKESDSITASGFACHEDGDYSALSLNKYFYLENTTEEAYWNNSSSNNLNGENNVTLVPAGALTVTFDPANGGEPGTVTVPYAGTVSQPSAPSLAGYTFAGWTLGGAAYDFSSEVKGDITLTAQWNAAFLDSDGSVVNQPKDDAVILNGADSDTLLNWSNGWYFVEDDLTISDRVTVSGDVRLVLFDGATLTAEKGITVEKTTTVEDGNTIENESSLTVYAQSAGEHMGRLTATSTDGNAAIGSRYNHADGTVTVNGGLITADATGTNAAGIGSGGGHNTGNEAACGTVIINGGNVTAKGSSSAFGIGAGSGGYGSMPITLSWCKDSNTRIDCKYYNSNNVTLDREYIFKFEDDESTAVTTGNINGKVLIPKEYVEAPEEPPVTTTYTVTVFLTDSSQYYGEVVSQQTVTEGECAVCPEAPEREGYTLRFWGYWYPETEFDFSTPITEDVYLYGYWSEIGGSGSGSSGESEMPYYNIAFDPNCSDAEGMMYWMWAYYDSPIELTANEYTRAGYVFTGWNTEADGSGTTFADEALIQEPLTDEAYGLVTLYAQWERIRYTVTIDAGEGCNVSVLAGYTEEDGGTPVQNGDSVEQGTVLTVTATAKTGYHLTETPDASYTVNGALTVTARAEKNTYAVTVTHDNGAAPAVAGADSLDAVPYGTQIVLTPGAAEQGYVFIGWYQPNGKLLYYNELIPGYTVTVTSAATIQARYQRESGVVTFMSNSNTVKSGDSTDYAYPSDPTPYYGYEFTGWDKTQEEIGTALAAGENITVNAVFAPIQKTITVTVYNGDSEEPTTATLQESGYYKVTAQEVAGKTFAYWTQDDSIRYYRRVCTFNVTADTTLRAVYTTDAVESVGTANINKATYNSSTRKLSFVAYLTVPDGATISAAGLYAASATSASYTGGALTAGNADYVKSSAKAVGTSGSVAYTWTKTNVSINDTWYVRPYVTYSYNSSTQTVCGDMVTVHAGCDYDSSEKATAVIRSSSYNSTTSKLSFVAYLTVPQGGTIVKAGLVAAPADSFDPSATILTWDTAAYQKSSAKAVGTSGSVTYTWTKTGVSAGDTWYVRPYVVYTDSSSKEHTVYGELFTRTA